MWDWERPERRYTPTAMTCTRCQAANRDGARFCRECGATFAAICAACGAKVEAGSKFCDSCGAPLAATSVQPTATSRFASPENYTPKHLAEKILTSKGALEGERKQVTVLFADLKASMQLLADRDPEEARKLLDPVLERMMEAIHRYEGTVNQVMGDGIMALFGAPVAHEDHAVRACYAALRMQEQVTRYAEDARRIHGVNVQIRVGLHSGEVVGWTMHSLGRASLLLGRLDEAQTLGERAIAAVPEHIGVAAHCQHLLADVATHPDRFDAERGEARYREALALAEPRGMRPLVAHCHLGLGKLYCRTGDHAKAGEHLRNQSDFALSPRMCTDPGWMRG